MHPVLAALEREGKLSDDDLQFLLDNGRSYRGVRLPSGIARRRPGACFDVADEIEAEGGGRYIRGFALRPGGRLALAHAWNSRDGSTAIDASWTREPDCSYWGLPRKHERRAARMMPVPFFHIPIF